MRGMGNMQGMMKQMKKLQKEMTEAQDELNQTEFTASSASDMVTTTFTGDKQLKDIKIKPEAIDPDDPDMLQDLIIEAVNATLKQVDTATQAKMGKYTRGLGM
ncbi:YbaB/EbfC family nucleoid-associated protein [Lacticaseibacillus parakribbianus]|uniref:YbaB/EbfC family nucleoid-associated protein n=1 Tax=Lacticaseibacillus parakribbianus TaxID=2970927 RepID=UPI0021CB8072|nr:YbaB/EbfC family nucleoid-associated protein [Lacticaseibacillus parakribbianus]